MTRRRKRQRPPRAPGARGIGREELLEAAIRVVRRDGPGASMDDIATEAGITKPILYRHFGDRSGLVAAVAEVFADELLGKLRNALASERDPRALLTATIDAYLEFVEAEPEICRFLVRRALRESSEGGSTTAGFVDRIGRDVAVVLGEQLRRAGQDSGPAEPWAYGIVGMVHLAGDWWSDRRTMPRERLVAYLSDLLWFGFEGIARAGEGAPGPAEDERRRVVEMRRPQ